MLQRKRFRLNGIPKVVGYQNIANYRMNNYPNTLLLDEPPCPHCASLLQSIHNSLLRIAESTDYSKDFATRVTVNDCRPQ